MDNQNLIVALYGRVSDKAKQGENFSIPTQLQMMREKCEKNGWTVYAELTEKNSAFINGLSRSELQKALELARTGKIQALMFFSSDRFTRDIGDGVILRKQLREYGVRLFCFWPYLQEIISDLEIMWILTDYASQKDAERRREASMCGIWGKVQAGLFPQGLPPYGYRVVGKHKDTHLEIDEQQKHVVILIFHWFYYDNVGVTEIARRLNAQGYEPSEHNRQSGLWTVRNVRNILKNKAYTGVWYAYTFKSIGKNKVIRRPESERVPIEIPQIISPTLWQGVQEKIATRHIGRTHKHDYLLSHRSRCKCGATNAGQTVSNNVTPAIYPYYRCVSNQLMKGWCGRPKFPAREVDDLVWKFAYELIKDPEKLLRGYQDYQQATQEEQFNLSSQIETLEERIAAQREELTELIARRDAAKSKSLKALLDQQCEAVGATIDEMEERLFRISEEQMNAPFSDVNIEEAIAEITQLRKMYEALETINEEADFEAKRALINILNLKTTLYVKENGEKWVDIHWLRQVHPKPVCTQKAISGRPLATVVQTDK